MGTLHAQKMQFYPTRSPDGPFGFQFHCILGIRVLHNRDDGKGLYFISGLRGIIILKN